MKRFDYDRDDKLVYTDVCEFFMPKNPTIRNHLRNRINVNDKNLDPNVSSNSATFLRRLFHKLLQIELNVDKVKQLLMQSPDFDVVAAFEIVRRETAKQQEKINIDEF
jgi:hypothetical protein